MDALWMSYEQPNTSESCARAMDARCDPISCMYATPLPLASYTLEFGPAFEDKSGHTLYEIDVSAPNGMSWKIHKRYSEIREFHDTLRLWLGNKLPPIPQRRLFGNHDPAFIEERKSGLERCLNGTLQLIASQPNLQDFAGLFLGWREQCRRGRAMGTASQRETHEQRSTPGQGSAPPVPYRRQDMHVEAKQRPRCASTEASSMAKYMRTTQPEHKAFTETPPAEGWRCRRRRWSRQPGADSQQLDTPRYDGVDDNYGSIVEEFSNEANVKETFQTPQLFQTPQVATTPVTARECTASSCVGQVTPTNLGASLDEVSPAPAPHGDAWDWPLSRPERKERVHLMEKHIRRLDRGVLIEEIEQLRARSTSRQPEPKQHE